MASKDLNKVRFSFGDDRIFHGFAERGTWNGFRNVCVTVVERDRIQEYFMAEGHLNESDDLLALPIDAWGLVSLANGYAVEIEPEEGREADQ